MNSFKSNFGFIVALVAILASLEFSFLSDTIVKNYEKSMANDYNIVIVSSKELTQNIIANVVPQTKSLEVLSHKKIIDRLSNDISAKNLGVLQNIMPKFYSLRLKSFPNSSVLNSLRSKLLKIDGVSKVETFSKTHDKIYKILNITRVLCYIFMGFIFIIGMLLMSRQISLWTYRHKERIEIMSLFGAPFLLKSAVLYKSAVIDAIVSALIVIVTFAFLPKFAPIQTLISQVDIVLPSVSFEQGMWLLGIAVLLSILIVSFVMARTKQLEK
ncbi:MAG: cell division protein FtsX [Campylobacter sp.]|nr:cell division protein FtsX [Campylobacter sp.]